MKTVLLAAGIGQRLGDVSANLPKCLLKFAGKTLLQRHLGILKHFAVSEIIIITGYQSDLVEQEIVRVGNDGHNYSHLSQLILHIFLTRRESL